MLSEHDVTNIHEIMAGQGDWFSARLLRLINGAGGPVLARLENGFPGHVALVRWWYDNRADAPAPLQLVGQF